MIRRVALLLAVLAALLLVVPLAGQDVAPGTAQNGSIQGTTSATCSVYHATGGAIVVGGTWVGTLLFESTVDGTNYLALPVTPQAGGATVTTTAANGTWSFTNAGYSSPAGVRVRASAWTSGTATTACTTVGATYLQTSSITALGPLSTPILEAAGSATAPSYSFTGSSGTGLYLFGSNLPGMSVAGTVRSAWGSNLFLDSTYGITWTSGAIGTAGDTSITRAAAAQLTLTSCLFAALGTPAAGTFTYCSDCLAASSPCTGASTGAWAFRQGGVWKCM